MKSIRTAAAEDQARRDNLAVGIGFAVASVFLFSVMAVLVKWLSETGYPLSQLLFFRNLGALPIVALVVMQSGGWALLQTRNPAGHLSRGILGLSGMSMLMGALTLLPLADATALNFAGPLFITALSVPLLGEKVGIHRWTAVIIGFAGVAIMAQPTGDVSSLGVAVALSGALFQALAMINIRYLSRTEPAATVFAYFTLFCLVMSFLGCFIFGWVTPGWGDLGLFLAVGLTGGVAQYFLTLSYRFAPAALIGTFNYSAIIWATLFGFLIFGHLPGLAVIGGATIVIACGLYITYREVSRKRPAASGMDGG